MENERMFWLWSVALNCLVAITIVNGKFIFPKRDELFKDDITSVGSN